MTPRIITDMSAEEYHRHPAISKSGLDKISISPAHYKYWLENKKPDTDALIFGSAFHTFLLEPDAFQERVAVSPKCDKRTKIGKELYEKFCADNQGKLFIGEDEHKQMLGMAESIKAHPAARILLNAKGKIEASIFWTDEETGVECRCRPDWLRDDGLIVDLKTCRSAHQDTFMRDAFNHRYHTQAAHYSYGVENSAGFVFIAAEKEPPYAVGVYQANVEFFGLGEKYRRRDMAVYAECLKNNEWPAYPDEIIDLGVPVWALKELGA